ncbi:hypothetical protein NXX77_00290 [Phocaeicola dorei]|nr:hypothetical protein [Phocaeicola dorei]
MAVSEEFQLRPLYEDLFYRYYRLATHADEGEKDVRLVNCTCRYERKAV